MGGKWRVPPEGRRLTATEEERGGGELDKAVGYCIVYIPLYIPGRPVRLPCHIYDIITLWLKYTKKKISRLRSL